MSTDQEDRGGASKREATAGLGDNSPEELVERWIAAWNWRDVDELLEMADPGIVLRPLRLRGLGSDYEGHEGVRQWMGTIVRENHDHRIAVSSMKALGGGRILAVGTVSIGGNITSPFSGIYEFAEQRMTLMAHYFTPASVLESIGILEPGGADL